LETLFARWQHLRVEGPMAPAPQRPDAAHPETVSMRTLARSERGPASHAGVFGNVP